MQRLNIVTLGVRDLEKSKSFFHELFGWHPTEADSSKIAFYDQGGWLFALFPWEHLAHDVTVSGEGQGFRGVTLAHNVRTKEEVAPLLERAVSCGAKIVKPAQDVFWGGHSGYFQDLDGHFWEVAWNPYLKIQADGLLDLAKN
ncbi:MAG: VOC family protein [Bdellovibrionaceae bacterium]|nr:VOC family protein [Pseudobdellovibrionaceae bacterium]